MGILIGKLAIRLAVYALGHEAAIAHLVVSAIGKDAPGTLRAAADIIESGVVDALHNPDPNAGHAGK